MAFFYKFMGRFMGYDVIHDFGSIGKRDMRVYLQDYDGILEIVIFDKDEKIVLGSYQVIEALVDNLEDVLNDVTNRNYNLTGNDIKKKKRHIGYKVLKDYGHIDPDNTVNPYLEGNNRKGPVHLQVNVLETDGHGFDHLIFPINDIPIVISTLKEALSMIDAEAGHTDDTQDAPQSYDF